MAITAITIENFKGIKDPVRVELKPITLLFGPNSAGKSTVVQALHYAREIFERQNLNPDQTLLGGDSMDLGGFENLVHHHDLSLPIRIRFDLDLEHVDLPLYYVTGEILGLMAWEKSSDYSNIISAVKSGWVEISIAWNNLLDRPLLTSYQVGINGEELATIETTDDGRQVNLSSISPFNPVFLGGEPSRRTLQAIKQLKCGEEISDRSQGLLRDVYPQFFELFSSSEGVTGITASIPLRGQNSVLPRWGNYLDFDESVWNDEVEYDVIENTLALLSSLITGPGELVRDALRSFCYVGPLRDIPKRGHRPATSPDASRWSNGLAAYDKLFYAEDDFIEKVNHWLTSDPRLNSGYSVELKKYRELGDDDPLILALQQDRLLDADMDLREWILNLPVKRRLLIRDEAQNVELEPQDIGVGISQVLPVVVAALSHKVGFVTVEQPELHIHPAFQVALGDLFIEQVRENPQLVFILETHSEHLLLRLMRRIRETAECDLPAGHPGFEPEHLSINFIDRGHEGGTCLRELEVGKDGDSAGQWPEGFFEERAGELF